MPWLLRDGQVLAAVEVAEHFGPRLRGLLGRDPSRSFTDELIAERHAAARAETEAEAKNGSSQR